MTDEAGFDDVEERIYGWDADGIRVISRVTQWLVEAQAQQIDALPDELSALAYAVRGVFAYTADKMNRSEK